MAGQKQVLSGGSTTTGKSNPSQPDTDAQVEKRAKTSKPQSVNQIPSQAEGIQRREEGRNGPVQTANNINPRVGVSAPPQGDAMTTHKAANPGASTFLPPPESAVPAQGTADPKEMGGALAGDAQATPGVQGGAAAPGTEDSSKATNAGTTTNGTTTNEVAHGAKDAETAVGDGGKTTNQVSNGEKESEQVGGGGTATGQVAPGEMNGDQTSNDDGNPAPKEKKKKVAKNKDDSAKVPWEQLSQEEQEKLTADGKLAIKDFHKAFEAFGFDDAAKRLRLSKEILTRIQTDQAYLPEAATSSMELGEAILLSNRSNSRCLFHQRKDKSGSNYDGHSQGSAKYFKILGVPGPRVMKLKKSDAKEPDEGLLHCGCAVDSALWELIWWKTWSVTCDVEGELVTESLLTDLPSPRMRLFIITALEAQGIRLEDFYTAISKDQTVRKNKIATLKDRLVKLLDKVNDLDGAKDGMQYIVARANRFRDEDDDGADARKEGKGNGKKRKVAQDDGDDDDDGSETDGDAKKKGKAKQKASKKETKGGPKKRSKVSE